MKDASDHIEDKRTEGAASAILSEKVSDYRGMAEPLLPVAEASVTQLRPGAAPSNLAIFSSENVSVLGLSHHAASVGVVIIKPECFSFMWWDGPDECRINGAPAERPVLYAQGDHDGFHAVGGARRTTGISVRRDHLVTTLAALRGVGPEDVRLDRTALRLSEAASGQFRNDVDALMKSALGAEASPRCGGQTADISEAFLGILLDAYLDATPEEVRRARSRSPEQIVRQAEERYFAAEGGPLSLADLCVAAGVSQSALYRAFHSICDEAPLAYFHKRRLTDARRQLINTPRRRGAVKTAALSVGLTEMGRFSVEYRQLFGESPSATLSGKEH
ncbi:helix-turn-helix transcriptional regulator [Salipiger pacificus]|nr:helix-turn-helix transcriptional regulator [Alloyangia pacifica]MCA0943873.1 helix-turn-helix transcriptional regulator [Alloyangia pacifica]